MIISEYNLKKYSLTSIILSLILFILLAYRFLPEFYPNSYFVNINFSPVLVSLSRHLYIVVAIFFVIYSINRLNFYIQINSGSLIFKKGMISPVKIFDLNFVDLRISKNKYIFLFQGKVVIEISQNIFERNSSEKFDQDIKNALYSRKRKILIEN